MIFGRDRHREGRLHEGQHYSWTYGGKPFGSISVRTEEDAMVLVFSSRRSPDSDWSASNSACQLPGRRATSAAVAPGFAVRSTPTVGIAGAGSRCSTALAHYSRVGAVTAWPMRTSRRRPPTAVLPGRKRSGFGSAEARTCVSRSRKCLSGCTGGRTCVFGLAASHRPQGKGSAHRRPVDKRQARHSEKEPDDGCERAVAPRPYSWGRLHSTCARFKMSKALPAAAENGFSNRRKWPSICVTEPLL